MVAERIGDYGDVKKPDRVFEAAKEGQSESNREKRNVVRVPQMEGRSMRGKVRE